MRPASGRPPTRGVRHGHVAYRDTQSGLKAGVESPFCLRAASGARRGGMRRRPDGLGSPSSAASPTGVSSAAPSVSPTLTFISPVYGYTVKLPAWWMPSAATSTADPVSNEPNPSDLIPIPGTDTTIEIFSAGPSATRHTRIGRRLITTTSLRTCPVAATAATRRPGRKFRWAPRKATGYRNATRPRQSSQSANESLYSPGATTHSTQAGTCPSPTSNPSYSVSHCPRPR